MACNCENCRKKHENYYQEGNQQPQGGCLPPHKEICGTTNRYENHEDMEGAVTKVRNDNYYDNYYTRYNKYYIKDYNHVTDYYRDVDIYYYEQEVVYDGCKYLGSTTKFEQEHHGCGCQKPPQKPCGCGC